MKAIYINLDPYLAAFAAWLAGGKVGTKPDFQPLPLAVTIPLGESAGIYIPTAGTSVETQEYTSATVDGVSLLFGVSDIDWDHALASEVVPGLSSAAPSAKYVILPVSGDSVSPSIDIADSDVETTITIPFTVLVNREQAQGPVDLVDFTPPLTAAAVNTALGGTGAATNAPLTGVKLTGATNAPAPSAADIKSALVAAGDGALDGVALGGAKIVANGEVGSTVVLSGASGTAPYNLNLAEDNVQTLGIASAS